MGTISIMDTKKERQKEIRNERMRGQKIELELVEKRMGNEWEMKGKWKWK